MSHTSGQLVKQRAEARRWVLTKWPGIPAIGIPGTPGIMGAAAGSWVAAAIWFWAKTWFQWYL